MNKQGQNFLSYFWLAFHIMLLVAIGFVITRLTYPVSPETSPPVGNKFGMGFLWATIVGFPIALVCAVSFRMRQGKVTPFAFAFAFASLFPTIAIYNSFAELDQNLNTYTQAGAPNPGLSQNSTAAGKEDAKQKPELNAGSKQNAGSTTGQAKDAGLAPTVSAEPNSTTQPGVDSHADFVQLKSASLQAEATMVGALVALYTAIVAGLSIVYSVFSVVEQRQHEQRLHQEDYNKELLREFNKNADVVNGKIILESVSRNSTYLPALHLNLYHDNAAANSTGKTSAILCAADKYYSNNMADEASTTILTEKESVEVIPTLKELYAALTPDRTHSKLPLMGIKICYSFDAFLEAFGLIGRLQLDYLKKQDELTDAENKYAVDIEKWWNALDLPYWSRLILWGNDSIDSDEDEKTASDKDDLNLSESSAITRKNLVEWVDNPSALYEEWEKIKFEDAKEAEEEEKTEFKQRHESDCGFEMRNMIRKYINEYYPEALQIALVLVIQEVNKDRKTAETTILKEWIRGVKH